MSLYNLIAIITSLFSSPYYHSIKSINSNLYSLFYILMHDIISIYPTLTYSICLSLTINLPLFSSKIHSNLSLSYYLILFRYILFILL